MGEGVKGFMEIKIHHLHCLSIIYSHGNILIKGYQLGQARLPLGEAMLTAPSDPLVLDRTRDNAKDKLFHHLTRDGGGADRPIVNRVLLLALFEDRSDTCFPPVFRHLSQCP